MRQRRFSLQVRLVLLLLTISLAPLAVSAVLIGKISEVAQNFASNHAQQLRPPLERAQGRFASLIEAKKELFRETVWRVATDPVVADEGIEASDLTTHLERQLETSPDMLSISVLAEDGQQIASARRPSPSRADLTEYREVEVSHAVDRSPRTVRAHFAADLSIAEDIKSGDFALKVSRRAERVRDSLPSSYVYAFLALVGGVVVLVAIFGIVVARRLSRRIQRLVEATHTIAGGDLEAQVEMPGRDELAALASAFNTMVNDLRSDRQQILYLQRISAWQDVARRLAHEIKNPLTPIQLAMQQVVSSYDGDDERFAKLLHDADEIVGEEITGLRRLVDAFSALGRLPRPDAKPLDLAVVLDDLRHDPTFTDRIMLSEPPDVVTVGGDRLLLRRLIANLVENGVQAGLEEVDDPADARVLVTWRAVGRNAVLTVDDCGPGIDPDDAERLFEPYVTSKETGTGLGLAICKKIALEHGGSLAIDPEPSSLGGARMQLIIPLASDESP